MCEKKFVGAGMGYCPIPRLGHDTSDCIVTQQAWAHRGWATLRRYARATQRDTARSKGLVSRYKNCIVTGGEGNSFAT